MKLVLHTLVGLVLFASSSISAEPASQASQEASMPSITEHESRQLALGALIAGFQVASAVSPLVKDYIETNKKRCHQLTCFIRTSSRTCALAVAEQVQAEVTKGRDRYWPEQYQDDGVRVRYWRTQFEPIDRGDIAAGNCTEGAAFTVTDCQSSGGRVHC